MTKAELRKRIRKLKRKNLKLIIEANAARARAGEAQKALAQWPVGPVGSMWRISTDG